MKLIADIAADQLQEMGIIRYISIDLFKGVSGAIYGYFLKKAKLSYSLDFSKKIFEKTSKLKLSDYEKSDTYDIIQRAQIEGGDKLVAFLEKAIQTIGNIIVLTSYASILFLFNIWFALGILCVPVSRYIVNKYFNVRSYHIIRDRTNNSRKLWYFSYLLSYGFAFKELKVYNLFNHFIGEFNSLKKSI